MNDWFAFTEREEILRLGHHETIDEAFTAADMFDVNYIWVFQREGLEQLVRSAQEALK